MSIHNVSHNLWPVEPQRNLVVSFFKVDLSVRILYYRTGFAKDYLQKRSCNSHDGNADNN